MVQAELLYQRGLPPNASYRFKHALIQDAAYQSLLKGTRQQYHQRIAQALAERFPETAEMQPEVLAQHYTAAGVHAEARPYWQRAGQLALKRSAHREAVASLEKGLEALPHLPQNRTTLEQAIDLQLALRTALRPLSDFERMLECLRDAETLAETLDDTRRLGQISVFLSNHFYLMGAYDQAIAAGQRILTLATADRDVVQHALANLRLGIAYQAQGDYRHAIDCFSQTVVALDGARQQERFGQVILPAVLSRALLTWCYVEIGMFADGTTLVVEGLQIAEAVDHPGSLMFAYYGVGLLALYKGDLLQALSSLERAVGICHEADFPAYFPRMAAALGAAYNLGGRIADSIPLLRQALEQSTATTRTHFEILCSLPLSAAQLLAGHLEDAHALAERVLAHARTHQERGNEAYALRLLGDIAAQREPPDTAQAEAYYQQALTLAEELGMRPLQAHCHHSLGRLYSQTGRAALARDALSTAIELYRAMDMTFWLPQAEAVLAQGK